MCGVMKGWTGISELFIVSRKNFKKTKVVILNLAECSGVLSYI